MKRLEEIQNELAKKTGYNSYQEYMYELHLNSDFYFFERIDKFHKEVSRRYVKECIKASLDKASENATYDYNQKYDCISVNKESITQKSNIIIL